MRRALIVLAALALVFGFGGTAAAADRTPTIYLALGDSLAWGDGASVPAHTGYVPRLAGYFHGASHGGADTLVNLAVRGETTTSMMAPGGQLTQALAVINDPATDVRMVTLSIGGNDLLNLINDPTDPCLADFTSPTCQGLIATSFGGVATRLPQILGALQAALAVDPGTEKVFVVLLYNPFGGTGNPLEGPVGVGLRGTDGVVDCAANVDPAKIGLDDIVGCTAMAFGDIVVDLYPAFGDRALRLTHMSEGFNVHPNDAGYALIARLHRVADRLSN